MLGRRRRSCRCRRLRSRAAVSSCVQPPAEGDRASPPRRATVPAWWAGRFSKTAVAEFLTRTHPAVVMTRMWRASAEPGDRAILVVTPRGDGGAQATDTEHARIVDGCTRSLNMRAKRDGEGR